MLRHNHVPCDRKPISMTHSFQLLFENDSGSFGVDEGFSSVAAKREKVKVTRVLVVERDS
jgi:hypothetical protein